MDFEVICRIQVKNIKYVGLTMLFNSYIFCFIFFPVTFIIYFWLNKRWILAGQIFLVLASLFFYGYWNLIFLPLILASILFNYIIGYSITKWNSQPAQKAPRISKLLLICGISGDLILLGYFKYADFFITNINAIAGTNLSLWRVLLPLGISFFTFTQIAYLVDSFRGIVRKHDLVCYSLFVSYFPHLLAGPIIHYKDMAPQFTNQEIKSVNWDNISRGLFLFAAGLFKKVILADTFANWANPGFAANYLNMSEAWAAALSYTFQIYFDFSGYTDMALGISLMLNIKLPQNFNSPYKANSIVDFWRRWHITLSNFLKDYLYIPLGGNRKGKGRRYLNLFLTMVLGGLWHGASWTFVLWGAFHGIGLTINHLWQDLGLKFNRVLGRCLTFGFVMTGWIFFRAVNLKQALVVFKGLINWKDLGLTPSMTSVMPWGRKEIPVLILFLLIVAFIKNSNEWMEKMKLNWRWAFLTGLLLLIAILNFTKTSSFLYYQF